MIEIAAPYKPKNVPELSKVAECLNEINSIASILDYCTYSSINEQLNLIVDALGLREKLEENTKGGMTHDRGKVLF